VSYARASYVGIAPPAAYVFDSEVRRTERQLTAYADQCRALYAAALISDASAARLDSMASTCEALARVLDARADFAESYHPNLAAFIWSGLGSMVASLTKQRAVTRDTPAYWFARFAETRRAMAAAAMAGIHTQSLTELLAYGQAHNVGFLDYRAGAAGRGEIVAVLGDIESANHVVILVPGMGADLDDFSAQIERAEAIRDNVARPDEVAVIAWLGYRAPSSDWIDGARQAASKQQAVEGAKRLAEFVRDLGLDEEQRLSLIGHSYGSLVVGKALAAGLHADNVIVAGSPGVGAGSLGALHLAEGTDFFALRAPGDVVSNFATGYGKDPADPGFGAMRMTVNEEGRPWVEGHGEYFLRGSRSVQNIAAAATDEQARCEVATLGDRMVAASSSGVFGWLDDHLHPELPSLPGVLDTARSIAQKGIDVAQGWGHTSERFVYDTVGQAAGLNGDDRDIICPA
jgi:hypothetical protein